MSNPMTADELIASVQNAGLIEQAGEYPVCVFGCSEYQNADGERILNVHFKTEESYVHYENFYLRSKTIYRLALLLKSLEIPPNDVKIDWTNFDMVYEYMMSYAVGRFCKISLEKNIYNGKTRLQIKKFEPLPEAVNADDFGIETQDDVPF